MADDIKSNSIPPDSDPTESGKHHEHDHHKSKHDKHSHDKHEKKIAELESQVADKTKEIEALKDKWLRANADFDNYRKRITKEKGEWRDIAQEEVITELLPVIDNFDRALASMLTSISNEHAAFAEGMQLVHKQFIDILTKYQVSVIDCVGKPFDPHFHEAMMTVPTAEYPEDTVVEEIQKGYMHNDKVIRPSMVKVSKSPQPISGEPAEPSPEPSNTNKNDEDLD